MNKNLEAEYVSPSMKNLLGYSPYFFIGSSVLRVVHTEDKQRLEKEITDTLKQKSPLFSSEYRVCTESGEIRWVETKARLFYNDQSIFNGAIYIQSDITDRKN